MTISRRRTLQLGLAASGVALLGSGAASAEKVFTEFGVAIRGADPVAFFTEREAVEGLAQFQHDWGGATWQFASAANRDRFAAAPESYAPQYKGWCAWAMTIGQLAPTDPTTWIISDGKLYLNFNRATVRRFRRDVPGNIDKADENWARLYA
ncbi:MAG: YHS domain-containing (seleno)protein [Pseudomonadota bacterium]